MTGAKKMKVHFCRAVGGEQILPIAAPTLRAILDRYAAGEIAKDK
jgi:hypothetical protein